jgi:PAS domain S-box-containing protein
MPSDSGRPTPREAALAQEASTLLEAAPDALIGVDRSGVIRFVNRQSEVLFGYDRDELVGTPLETLVPDSLRQVHRGHREGYNADPSTRPMGAGLRVNGKRREGAPFPVDIALSYVQTADGPLVVAAVHDMTSYRRAEDERRRADRLSEIVEHSDDAIIGRTLEGIVTSWNPAAERMYGYTSEAMIGKSIGLLAPRSRSGEMKSILAGIRAGQSVDHEETVRIRKDGTAITISLSVSPTRGAGGVIVGASETAHDLTGQLQAFAAARSMIEASLDSLVAISPEGKITDANQATVRLTGVPRDKLIGTAFSDYFTDPAKAEEIYQLVFSEGMAVDYPLTVRHHDGRETLTEVLYNASVYRDAEGNVLGVFAAARDVTNQKRAFQAARSMIEASLDSLVAISPEGKITDANQATVKLTGVPRDKLIGTAFSDYFTDPAKAEEIYQLVFSEGMAVDYPLTLRHHNGRETLTEVLYNASVYRDAEGNVLGVFAAARDVTNQKQAQREIAEQQATAMDRLAELERFHRLTVGREVKMIELKKEIEYLRMLDDIDGSERGEWH